MAESRSDEYGGLGQPILDQLVEARKRLLRVLLVILTLFVPVYYYANDIYDVIAGPLLTHLPSNSGMIATEVASPFFTPLKLAVVTSVFVAMPFLLHQAWSLVSPGLYLMEKRFAALLLSSSVLLFYAGSLFAYILALPLVLQFFAAVTPEGVSMMTDINHYLDFVLKMLFAFGLAFEIPVAILLIVWSGITTAEALARARPYVVVGCCAVGMLLTPPDVISQLMLALPAWMLFEVGVYAAKVLRPELHGRA